ncbi:MAG: AraC family transcriptional regulator [Pseudoxanthomonas sp.]
MSLVSRDLAAGPGWRVSDVICNAGPRDRPFEERHDGYGIAIVGEGSFRYRTGVGRALLGPGALLLGNHDQCFECGHEHAAGDRCLAFHYSPETFERIVAEVPGARRAELPVASLPPLEALAPLLAAAEAARDDADVVALEEMALRLAGVVVATVVGARRAGRRPSVRDERRITRAVRRIEAGAGADMSLSALAEEAAMSPYHFLRVFRQGVGMTPHQYLLRLRLHRAATRLLRSDEPIAAIAYACGFADLSTFNRRFRRVMGVAPGAWRARWQP